MNCAQPAKVSLLVVVILLMMFNISSAASSTADTRTKRSGAGDDRMNLRQAISTALARNLKMADSRLAIAEKEYQRRSAFSDFFPTIDLTYQATGYRYQQDSNVAAFSGTHDSRWSARYDASTGTNLTPDYPYRIDPYKTFSLSATVTQPLYTGGRLLNDYKYTRLGVDYSQIQYQVDIQDLTLDVTEAYYQMIQAEKLLEVAEQSIRALEALRNQTSEFYKAGVVPKVDVLSTEGQLAQAQIQKTQAQADIERYRATLNYLLRYPQETPLQIVPDFAYRPNPYSIPSIYNTAAANRLEIRQANISVEQAIALVRSAKGDLLPQVALVGQGTRVNDDWNSFDPEAVNDWRIQGLLTWTFDMFRQRSTVQERRASQARAFIAQQQLVEQIMEEVKVAYVDMKRSEADIENNRKAVAYRSESFRNNQERYKEQVATYVEVLDAQRQLSQSEGDYITSLIGYRINRAILERRMGILR